MSIVIDLNLFQLDKKHCYDIKRKWIKMESEELLKMSYEINWEFDRVCSDMSVEELWDEVHGKLLTVKHYQTSSTS